MTTWNDGRYVMDTAELGDGWRAYALHDGSFVLENSVKGLSCDLGPEVASRLAEFFGAGHD